jgi:hypothetical protein
LKTSFNLIDSLNLLVIRNFEQRNEIKQLVSAFIEQMYLSSNNNAYILFRISAIWNHRIIFLELLNNYYNLMPHSLVDQLTSELIVIGNYAFIEQLYLKQKELSYITPLKKDVLNEDESSNKNKEVSLSVNPEVSLSVNPVVALSVNPEVSLSVNPEVSLSMNPEVSLSVNPEVSLSVNPAVALSVNPEVSLSVNPENSLIEFDLNCSRLDDSIVFVDEKSQVESEDGTKKCIIL